jgi:PAS domain S-box-containing protein
MTGPQGKKGTSIQSRLILLLLFILVPVLAIQAYMYYESYQARRTSELQANLEIARVVAKAFESFVQDVLHQELAIGLAITSSQPMTSGDITRILEASRDNVAVRDFSWMNLKGDVIYSGNPAMVGNNYSDRSYFYEVANGREWMVSELIMAKTTGEPVFGISRGIRDSKGALLGIVLASIIPEKLDARLAVERSKGGGHALVDHKGTMVYRYPAINTTWEGRNWVKQYPQFEEALKGKEISATVFAPYEGKNRLVGFTPVSSIGWAASAGRTEEEVTWPILISITDSALLLLSVSIAAFFIALAVSRKIVSPVTALRAHAFSLAHGEVPEQVKSDHVTEFQDLAEAFNTMAEKVRAREMDLRKSEERFRLIASSTPDHLLVQDRDLRYTLVINPQLGLTEQDMIGKTDHDFLSKENADELTKIKKQVLETGHPVHLEIPLLSHQGEQEYFNGSYVPTYGADGRVDGLVGYFRNVTKRKWAEEELRKERDFSNAVLDTAGALVVVLDKEGRITRFNRACEEITGYLAEEVRGRVFLELLIPPEEVQGVRQTWDALRAGDFPNQHENHWMAKDGSRRLIAWSNTAITREDGSIDYIIGTGVDITERKQAEEKIRNGAAELEAIFATQDDAVLVYDAEMNVKRSNPTLRTIYGFDPVGLNVRDVIRRVSCRLPDGQPLVLEDQPTPMAIRGNRVSGATFIVSRADGTDAVVQTSSSPMYVGDHITGSVTVWHDITELKRAEDDLRKSEETLRLANETLELRVLERTMDLQNLTKQLESHRHELRKLASELVVSEERERKRIAGVLHDEIAQTLAAARMRIDMLQGIPSDPKDKQTLEETRALLLQSIRETRTLMNDIGNPLLFDLGVKAACEALASRLMERHSVRIHCDIRDAYKHLDPNLKTIVFQVVRELLHNVVKHSKAQHAHVVIDMANGSLRVKVTDDGAGFDPKTLGAPSSEGGFGLYSIRERLMAIDGTLRIESAPGAGSAVVAILPPALD